MKVEDLKKLKAAEEEMIYPQAQEHSSSPKGKITTTSIQDQRADSQQDYPGLWLVAEPEGRKV